MTTTLTTRLPDEVAAKLKSIAEKENLDVSSVVRRLLANAISAWRVEYATEQYKKGKFSFEQLAKFSQINVWGVTKLLKEKKVPLNYDKEEFERELKNL